MRIEIASQCGDDEYVLAVGQSTERGDIFLLNYWGKRRKQFFQLIDNQNKLRDRFYLCQARRLGYLDIFVLSCR
jgi:hypothetical protein